MREWEFDAVLQKEEDSGGAYVFFPYDLKEETGKGRLKVHAEFDGVPYDGSVVHYGKGKDSFYCIGVRRDIRAKIGKSPGDTIHVKLAQRED